MYTYTWKKYLPLIRILLKRSSDKATPVQLNRMDFDKNRNKHPASLAFSFDFRNGRPNQISMSQIAKELVAIVAEDEVGHQLIRKNNYRIGFTNSCELSIENISVDEHV